MTSALLLCLVIGISDGDTLQARCDTAAGRQNIRVRLAQIDAPERSQPWGQRSRRNLAALCLRKAAQLQPQALDRYGRTVAQVRCDGADAAASQVQAGLAWVWERDAEDLLLVVAQREARAARRGLWGDAAPVPPWQWRRQRAAAGS